MGWFTKQQQVDPKEQQKEQPSQQVPDKKDAPVKKEDFKQISQSQNHRDSEKQSQNYSPIKKEDMWIYESLLQFVTSPIWKTPINTFIDEHCFFFEDISNPNEDQYQIYLNYQEIVDLNLFQFAEDLGVDPSILTDMIMLGLVDSNYRKYFIYFQIYHHYTDFIQLMAKHNLDLEKEAMNSMAAPTNPYAHTKPSNSSSSSVSSSSTSSQFPHEPQQQSRDYDLEAALRLSMQDSQKPILDLDEALQKSKLEYEAGIKKQMNQEEELMRRAIEESLQDSSFSSVPPPPPPPLPTYSNINSREEAQRKLEELKKAQELRKAELEQKVKVLKIGDEEDGDDVGEELSNIGKLPTLIQLNSQEKRETATYHEQLQQERQDMMKKLNSIPPPSSSSAPKQESIEERKARLKAQRDALLNKQQQEREVELQEFTSSRKDLDEPDVQSNVSESELDKRRAIYANIKKQNDNL